MNKNLDGLRQFLLQAKQVYASGNEKKLVKEKDSSTSIYFAKGEWTYHDNFFGGEPYGGREVAFFQEKPVWMMVYFGDVNLEIKDPNTVYPFLQKALSRMPRNLPLRGPKVFEEGEWRYENSWEGELVKFSGNERILCKGKPAYHASYMGGLVDQRR